MDICILKFVKLFSNSSSSFFDKVYDSMYIFWFWNILSETVLLTEVIFENKNTKLHGFIVRNTLIDILLSPSTIWGFVKLYSIKLIS